MRQVRSPPSRTGTSVSALRPCCPLARSLHSCLRFHRTVVPMDDVRCSLRLFLSSCRNPWGRWRPWHVAYLIFPGYPHHWITCHSVLVACHSLIPAVWCVWLHASFAPLRPVSHAVSCSGSGLLDTLGFSAVWFCPGMRSPCGVLYT